MAWTSRAAVSTFKTLAIGSGIAVLILLASLILGFTGPKVFTGYEYSAYECPGFEHFDFDPVKCAGYRPISGAFSPSYTVNLVPINRRLLVTVTPYVSKNATVLLEDMLITSVVRSRNSKSEPWSIVSNATLPYAEDCLARGRACNRLVILDDSNLYQSTYAVSIAFHTKSGIVENLQGLEDVVTTLWYDSPGYSKMMLLLRLFWLAISVAALIYHLLLLKRQSDREEEWRLEQKALVSMLFAVSFFNNPLYPIQFVLPGPGLEIFSVSLETAFVGAVFLYFFVSTQSKITGSEKIEYNRLLIFQSVCVLLFCIFQVSVGMFVSLLDMASPYFALWDTSLVSSKTSTIESAAVDTITGLFWTKTVLFFVLIAASGHCFYALYNAWNDKPYLRFQFRLFVLPALILLFSWCVEIFVDNSVTFYGRETPGSVYLLSVANVYVLLLVWSHWPIRVSLGGGKVVEEGRTEEDKLFTTATDGPDSRYGTSQVSGVGADDI